MMRVRVKFCGITSAEDAEASVNAGADAVGLVFFEDSPRYVTLEKAELIVASLPPFVTTVGIFVNEDLGFIEECAIKCNFGAIQLHGDENAKYCSNFRSLRLEGVKLIKAIRVKDKKSLAPLEDCPADAFLLDTYKSGFYGGTGRGFDRDIAAIAKEHVKYLIISGGLNPQNVYDVIKQIQPYAVDVSSGIESSPGKKNPELMEEFVREVRRAER